MLETDKRLCPECHAKMRAADVLTAPNPFEAGDTITGCPRCRNAVAMRCACDEPGCWGEVSCGFKSGDGPYRHTCSQHYPG